MAHVLSSDVAWTLRHANLISGHGYELGWIGTLGDDTLPRNGVEVSGRRGRRRRAGGKGAERAEGAAVLLHLHEGDGVAQHLRRSVSLSHSSLQELKLLPRGQELKAKQDRETHPSLHHVVLLLHLRPKLGSAVREDLARREPPQTKMVAKPPRCV